MPGGGGRGKGKAWGGRGRGRGRSVILLPGVTEESEMEIREIMERFQASDERELHFDADLSKPDRALVHDLAMKMGMTSKSTGKGANRRVCVRKKRVRKPSSSSATELFFRDESQAVIMELFAMFPPTEEELTSALGDRGEESSPHVKPWRPRPVAVDPMVFVKQRAEYAARFSNPALQKINEQRMKLPIASFQEVINEAVVRNQVVLIAGETGCGKTTQALLRYQSVTCPEDKSQDKLKLRDLLPTRPDLRLVMMSATLNADLYSKYFGGCPLIEVPGLTYPVRSYFLEDILPITYPGLAGKGEASSSLKKASRRELSEDDQAAMDEALANAWFQDDLESLMELVTGCDNSADQELVVNYQHRSTGATALMVAAGKGAVDEVALLLANGADTTLVANDGSSALDMALGAEKEDVADMLVKWSEKLEAQRASEKAAEDKAIDNLLGRYYASVPEVDAIDTDLVQKLLEHICSPANVEEFDKKDGAILVFLPGWEDILKLKEQLQNHPMFGDPAQCQILPLHSMVASQDQRKVFQRPPKNVRKIVLSTNIAETAVTIDDIVYVLDGGRAKEKSYDPFTNVSTLQVCHTVTASSIDLAMPAYQVAEMKRMPLEELCLQVKSINENIKVKDFLGKALEPPIPKAVSNAVLLLQDIGAFDHEEKITRLGKHLAALPLHPCTGKMLLHALLFDCLDPALTMACEACYRDPFSIPVAVEQRKRYFDVKRRFSDKLGGCSDHLAVISLFEEWDIARRKGREREFCVNNFVSNATMFMLSGMRQQLVTELRFKGFVKDDVSPCSGCAKDPGIVRAVLTAGMYPQVGSVLPPMKGSRSMVLTPHGEKVRIHPHSLNYRLAGRMSDSGGDGGSANRSAGDSPAAWPLIVYNEITRNDSNVSIRSSTLVKPHAIVFLAAEMVVAPLSGEEEEDEEEDEEEEGEEEDEEEDEEDEEYDEDDEEEDEIHRLAMLEKKQKLAEERRREKELIRQQKQQEQLMSDADKPVAVVIDRWLRFRTTAMVAAQLFCLRERMSAAFAFKVKHPSLPLPPVYDMTMRAIAHVLSCEGEVPSVGRPMWTGPEEVNQEMWSDSRRQTWQAMGTFSDEPEWEGRGGRGRGRGYGGSSSSRVNQSGNRRGGGGRGRGARDPDMQILQSRGGGRGPRVGGMGGGGSVGEWSGFMNKRQRETGGM
ncbi:hypothetical protein CBR_g50388 [Chara braunii]|uniref:RNA helicase n=1 Tax=Chara braunii TaxID=69332 RepID=A0A388M6U4_CHABU|nr:hypothetical protein CBR_g50388 [Chara braunii]|eukprot:GBG90209.1 hypothetical protein CBR_g50388 [Chara braunii]